MGHIGENAADENIDEEKKVRRRRGWGGLDTRGVFSYRKNIFLINLFNIYVKIKEYAKRKAIIANNFPLKIKSVRIGPEGLELVREDPNFLDQA